MAPTTRKRAKVAATPVTPPVAAKTAVSSQSAKDSEDEGLTDSSLSELSSIESDFEVSKKRKRVTVQGKGKGKATAKATVTKPAKPLTAFEGPALPALALPDLSDDDEDDLNEPAGVIDVDDLFAKERCHNAKASVETKKSGGLQELVHQAGPAVINTSLKEFLANSNLVELLKSQDAADLLKDAGLKIISGPTLSAAVTEKDLPGNTESSTSKKGFLDLPSELREKIYKLVFIVGKPVDFTANQNRCLSAQFLKTCKTVYKEGTAVLYGENSFHFSRETRVKGKYHHQVWREVAYKGVRKFLEEIHPSNVKLLQHVSFTFTDATDNRTRVVPGSLVHHRFVDDPHVHEILRLLAVNPGLKTFAVQFAGRGMVTQYDRRFVRGITEVKCWRLFFITYLYGRGHKIAHNVKEKMPFLMKVRDENGECKVLAKPKNPVKMVHDFGGSEWHGSVSWEEALVTKE
ncbi:hypothetical protein H2200_003562 [Cladophialophora chaetospira]|uniref:Uncharacterized protein n=1 Tax=Cladophialophora chaetospira TaxID=386627 RepID=A0AA38XEN6_9EURO|nr:hypothetical protein H2200_003562 [Cladophialophora chaetospira]